MAASRGQLDEIRVAETLRVIQHGDDLRSDPEHNNVPHGFRLKLCNLGIAKQELKAQWVAGPFLRRLGTIFARRLDRKAGVEDIESILDAARCGAKLVTMPEGTFSRMPGLLPFRLGAFLVAARAGVPVIPVTIKGTRMILRSDQWFPRRAPISVHIGKPVRAEGADFRSAIKLRNECRDVIQQASGEPDLSYEHLAPAQI